MNKFLAEIYEQPTALSNTLNFYCDGEGKNALEKIKNIHNEKSFEQIVFTGMGSSYFISFAASTLFNDLKINSFVINSSELLHYNFSLLDKSTLMICFSQSGESFEIKEILNKISKNVFCVGITNEKDSTLAKKADVTLLSKAGREEMTSTKTYVTGSLVSFILAWSLADKWNAQKMGVVENFIKNFKLDLDNHNHWLDDALDFIGDISALQIIARGSGYSTALQSGLMFKEALKLPASGILGGEFRHGPIEMVQPGFKSILFAPLGKTYEQSIIMANDIANSGGKVLLISNTNIDSKNDNILNIHLEEQDEFLFSIQSIIPIQLFIDSFAKRKGFKAGSFAIGGKVTMRE